MTQTRVEHITPGQPISRSGGPNTREDDNLPLTIYGPEISYFTGKLEAVVRYMELPYTRIPKSPMGELARATGVAQVPGLQLADGRWLTDTTPIINWLNNQYPEFEVIPKKPILAFFCRLVEDYADEWLWRPAMHYRWDYEESAAHQSRVLIDEAAGHVPLPRVLKQNIIRNRQRALFTRGDGVSPETWDHVEKSYLDTLTQLATMFDSRPFLLGDRPCLADFGMFGPAFRHFSMDPTSARIMRETAPSVFEWVARVWNARAGNMQGDLLADIPEDWTPLLNSIGSAYLPYLCANADAHNAGKRHFNVTVEGVTYRNLRTAPYRVWCLEELRRHFTDLSGPDQETVRQRLEAHGCWEPLWRTERLNSGVDPERKAPFGGGGSATGLDEKDAEKMRWVPVAAASRE